MSFRWNCGTDGCWNDKFRLKYDPMGMNRAVPGSRKWTDVDAICHVDGHFLMQEWKDWPEPQPLPLGQHLMFQAITATCPNVEVLAVLGSTEAGTCHHAARYCGGRMTNWKPYTLDDLNEWIRLWGLRSLAAPLWR
jgi:hypothetical protein